MGLITERGSAADGYEAVPVPLASGEAAKGGVMLRRRSALPTRRSVLYLHCRPDTFVPEDLAGWYTERGFHFYVADLRPQEGQRADRSRDGRFARLDAAFRCLREAEGHDMIILSAASADAAIAAQWCDARRDPGGPDALILSSPVFGRRLRRGLDIGCPVLVLSPAAGPAGGRLRPRRTKDPGAIKLGQHVTWLRLESGLDGQDADRRLFFDEMGRWLGAYMYGGVRDQLL
jgi:alpha-beta hydrolase superfamily lysophospholipase